MLGMFNVVEMSEQTDTDDACGYAFKSCSKSVHPFNKWFSITLCFVVQIGVSIYTGERSLAGEGRGCCSSVESIKPTEARPGQRPLPTPHCPIRGSFLNLLT